MLERWQLYKIHFGRRGSGQGAYLFNVPEGKISGSKERLKLEIGLIFSSGEHGFTLLEVLVALVILGLTVAFLANTIFDSMARAERMDTDNRAIALASTILARIGEDIPVRVGTTQGRDGKLSWRLIVDPYRIPLDTYPMDQLDLTIKDQANHLIGDWQTLRLAAQ